MNNVPNIPYFYNRASNDELGRLRTTFQHFGIDSHQSLVGESLLRLDRCITESGVCLIPTDPPGKALFMMFKFFSSLN